MVMSKLRVLQVTLLNLMEVSKRKWECELRDDVFWKKDSGKCTKEWYCIYSLHNDQGNRACSSIRYKELLHSWWNSIYWIFNISDRTATDRVKIISYTNITKRNKVTSNERFNRFTIDQGTNRFTANTATNSFSNTNITSAKRLVSRRKDNRSSTAHNRYSFINSLVQTGLLVETT